MKPPQRHLSRLTLLSLAVLVPLAGRSQGAVDLHVIARTGQAGLATINNYVSINNGGLVAFRGITADGFGSFVADASGPRAVRPINDHTMVQPILQLNDSGILVARRGPFIYPPTYYPPYAETTDYLQTWAADGTGGLTLVANGVSRTDSQTLQTYKVGPFCSVGLATTINNVGRVAFLADQGDGITISYALATPAADGYNTYPCNGFVFPMLADDGHIVLRSGSAANSPIVLLNYDLTPAETIASSGSGFTALGRMPGISDDGQYVAFYGELSSAGAATLGTSAGPGIFLSYRASGVRTTIRLAGLTNADSTFVFSGFDGNQRVGVNRQTADGNVNIVFAATNGASVKGVWVCRFDPANPFGISLVKVVLQSDQVNGIGPFDDFRLADPVNTQGRFACWASSGTQQAVLQASVPITGIHLKALDANPSFLGSVFLIGARLPLDPGHPHTTEALNVLSQAKTSRNGLAADGCSQLLVRFEADVPGIVTFHQANTSLGALTDVYGSPFTEAIPAVAFRDKYMAFAIYTAPDVIQQNTETDQIQVSFLPTGWGGQPLETSFQITVIRTPVVLVHGLWGKPSVWDFLDTQLRANGFLTSRVDYHWCLNAAGSFETYRGFVWYKVRSILEEARALGFAVTRADVVAHSMGGILTRLDASDPLTKEPVAGYPSCFRRVITVDTPHFGSRAATVLLGLGKLQWLYALSFKKGGNPIDLGGVADLDPVTFAQSLGSVDPAPRVGAMRIPAVAIACTVASQGDLPLREEKLVYDLSRYFARHLTVADQQKLFCGQTISKDDLAIEVANKIFSIPQRSPDPMLHDGIVPLTSQRGGCSLLASGLPFPFVAHTAAPADSGVDQQVISFLKGDLAAFDANGFPPVTTSDLAFQKPVGELQINVPTPPLRTPKHDDPQTQLIHLSVLSPSAPASPGASVTVSVDALPGEGIDSLFVMAVQDHSAIASATGTNVPFLFTFTAPTNTLGTITIVAVAANGLDEMDLQETNLVLQIGGATSMESLAVTPPSFSFTGIGQGGQLAVSAVCLDGSRFDLTSAGAANMYSPSSTNVVSVDSNGVVTAVGQGTTTVAISYGTLAATVPVTVSLQQPEILSTSPSSGLPGSNAVPLVVLGSCLGGASRVEFFRDAALDPTISATNLVVGAGGLNMMASVSIAPSAPPGLRTVVVTTPAGRSSVVGALGNRFFVGMPLLISDYSCSQTASTSLQIHMHLVGTPGVLCLLESSTNLTHWDPVATNTLLGGDWFFDKFLPAGQNVQFYRPVLLP